jgi:hypothetical protein
MGGIYDDLEVSPLYIILHVYLKNYNSQSDSFECQACLMIIKYFYIK